MFPATLELLTFKEMDFGIGNTGVAQVNRILNAQVNYSCKGALKHLKAGCAVTGSTRLQLGPDFTTAGDRAGVVGHVPKAGRVLSGSPTASRLFFRLTFENATRLPRLGNIESATARPCSSVEP